MAVTATAEMQRHALRPSTRDFGTQRLIPTAAPRAGVSGAVAVHSSSPPVAAAASNTTTSVTTASFTPPAGSVIVVAIAGNSSLAARDYTITNTGTPLTWIKVFSRDKRSSVNDTGSSIAFFYAINRYYNGPMTVTSTPNTTVDTMQQLRVTVLTGVDLNNPVGGTNQGTSPQAVLNDGSNYSQAPIRTSRPNSVVFTAITDWNASAQFTAPTLTASTVLSNADLKALTGYSMAGAAKSQMPMRVGYGAATPVGHIGSVEFQAAISYRTPDTTIFYDDFERPDGTVLGEGDQYIRTTNTGTVQTVSGIMQITGTLNQQQHHIYRPLDVKGDYDVYATIGTNSGSTDAGLIGGYLGPNDTFHFFSYMGHYGYYSQVNNEYTELSGITPRMGDVMRLSRRGRKVLMYANGALLLEKTLPDGKYDNGAGAVAGFQFYPDFDQVGPSSARFSDLRVTVPPKAANLPLLYANDFGTGSAPTWGAPWEFRQQTTSAPVVEGQGRLNYVSGYARSAMVHNRQYATGDLEQSGTITYGTADGIFQIYLRAAQSMDGAQDYTIDLWYGESIAHVNRSISYNSTDLGTPNLGFPLSNVPFKYRAQVVTQVNRVLLRFKVWPASGYEPYAWTEVPDTTPERLVNQGYLGVAILGGATSFITLDDFAVRDARSVIAYRGLDTFTPSNTAEADDGAVWLGLEFYVTEADCSLSEIRFYAPSLNNANTYLRKIMLFSSGDELQLIPLTTGGAVTLGAWNTIALPTPYALVPNKRYRAAVYHYQGRYAAQSLFFSSGAGAAGLVRGPLVIPQASQVAGNQQGGFAYYGDQAVAAYPSGQFNAANYWTDVTITKPGQGLIEPAPPVVTPVYSQGQFLPFFFG